MFLDSVLQVELILLKIATVGVLQLEFARHLRQLGLQAKHLSIFCLKLDNKITIITRYCISTRWAYCISSNLALQLIDALLTLLDLGLKAHDGDVLVGRRTGRLLLDAHVLLKRGLDRRQGPVVLLRLQQTDKYKTGHI